MKLINKKSYCTEATEGSLTDTHPLHTHTALTLLPEGLAGGRDKLKKGGRPFTFRRLNSVYMHSSFSQLTQGSVPFLRSQSTSQPVTKLNRFYATHKFTVVFTTVRH